MLWHYIATAILYHPCAHIRFLDSDRTYHPRQTKNPYPCIHTAKKNRILYIYLAYNLHLTYYPVLFGVPPFLFQIIISVSIFGRRPLPHGTCPPYQQRGCNTIILGVQGFSRKATCTFDLEFALSTAYVRAKFQSR